MAQRVYKDPRNLARTLNYKMPPTLMEKWNSYFRHIGDGNPRTVDKYNKLIEEIEQKLPFKDDAEHQKWLDLSAAWKGESEWPNMTQDLIRRYNQSSEGIDDYQFREFIKDPEEYQSSHDPFIVKSAINHGLKFYPDHPYFKENGYEVKEWK